MVLNGVSDDVNILTFGTQNPTFCLQKKKNLGHFYFSCLIQTAQNSEEHVGNSAIAGRCIPRNFRTLRHLQRLRGGRKLRPGEIFKIFVLLGRFRYIWTIRLFLKTQTIHGLFFEMNLLIETHLFLFFFHTFIKTNAQNGIGDLETHSFLYLRSNGDFR